MILHGLLERELPINVQFAETVMLVGVYLYSIHMNLYYSMRSEDVKIKK